MYNTQIVRFYTKEYFELLSQMLIYVKLRKDKAHFVEIFATESRVAEPENLKTVPAPVPVPTYYLNTVPVPVPAPVPGHVHTYKFTNAYTYMCTYSQTNMYTHIETYTYTVHIHTHICTNTYTQNCACMYI
jgi:hypothetical protein